MGVSSDFVDQVCVTEIVFDTTSDVNKRDRVGELVLDGAQVLNGKAERTILNRIDIPRSHVREVEAIVVRVKLGEQRNDVWVAHFFSFGTRGYHPLYRVLRIRS